MKVLNEFKTEVRTELEGQGAIRLLFSFSGQCQETSWCKIVSVAQHVHHVEILALPFLSTRRHM